MAVFQHGYKFFDNCPIKKWNLPTLPLNLSRLATVPTNRAWEMGMYRWVLRISHERPCSFFLILGALTYHTKGLTAMKPLYCGQAACCCQQSPAQALAICERRSFQMAPAPAIQVLPVEDPGIQEPTHHAISKFLTCGTYPQKKKSGGCIISLSLG